MQISHSQILMIVIVIVVQ